MDRNSKRRLSLNEDIAAATTEENSQNSTAKNVPRLRCTFRNAADKKNSPQYHLRKQPEQHGSGNRRIETNVQSPKIAGNDSKNLDGSTSKKKNEDLSFKAPKSSKAVKSPSTRLKPTLHETTSPSKRQKRTGTPLDDNSPLKNRKTESTQSPLQMSPKPHRKICPRKQGITKVSTTVSNIQDCSVKLELEQMTTVDSISPIQSIKESPVKEDRSRDNTRDVANDDVSNTAVTCVNQPHHHEIDNCPKLCDNTDQLSPTGSEQSVYKNAAIGSRLMALLTSEHDYFKKKPQQWSLLDKSMSDTVHIKPETEIKCDAEPKSEYIYDRITCQEAPVSKECIEEIVITSKASDTILVLNEDNCSSLPVIDSASNEGPLGYDVNDFVMRRRRLRSESTKEELWDGIPFVVPFRKLTNKPKDRDDNDEEIEISSDLVLIDHLSSPDQPACEQVQPVYEDSVYQKVSRDSSDCSDIQNAINDIISKICNSSLCDLLSSPDTSLIATSAVLKIDRKQQQPDIEDIKLLPNVDSLCRSPSKENNVQTLVNPKESIDHSPDLTIDTSATDNSDPATATLSSTSTIEIKSSNGRRRDKRKRVPFPKIVLRKCSNDHGGHTKGQRSSRGLRSNRKSHKYNKRLDNSSESADQSLTPKRSLRISKRFESSSKKGRSIDFVYTPLKRDETKVKSPTATTDCETGDPSPSVKIEPSVLKSTHKRKTPGHGCTSKAKNSSRKKSTSKITKRTTNEEVKHGTEIKVKVDNCESENEDNNKSDTTFEPGRQKKVKKKYQKRSSEEKKSHRRGSCTRLNFGSKRKKTSTLNEELLSNLVVDKHACVLWSSEHRRHFQMTNPDATSIGLDEIMRDHWSQKLTDCEKMKYFIRARDALKDEDKHGRKSTKERRPQRSGQNRSDLTPEMTSLEQFTRLKTRRQKDLLTKWLHFFQKVLSRKEYAEFIEDVKQGILDAEVEDKPNKSRGLTSKIFSHKKLLFLKMNKLKDYVMLQYCQRKRKRKEFRALAFNILVSRLIQGKGCAVIKGCRSKKLTRILQDLCDLEYGDSVAVLGYPVETSSFTNLYKEIVETVDSCMFRDAAPIDCSLLDPIVTDNKSDESIGTHLADKKPDEKKEDSGNLDEIGSSKKNPEPTVSTETCIESDKPSEIVGTVDKDQTGSSTTIIDLTTSKKVNDLDDLLNIQLDEDAMKAILNGIKEETVLQELDLASLGEYFEEISKPVPILVHAIPEMKKTLLVGVVNPEHEWNSRVRPPKLSYGHPGVSLGNSVHTYMNPRCAMAIPLALRVPPGQHMPNRRPRIITDLAMPANLQSCPQVIYARQPRSKMYPAVSSNLPGSLLGGRSVFGVPSYRGPPQMQIPTQYISRRMPPRAPSPVTTYRPYLIPPAHQAPIGGYREMNHMSMKDMLHAEARNAFNRSYTSNTESCCDMDSPACILSTWVAEDKVKL